MPLTKYACPRCGACLHTDDLLEGVCITGGCGKPFDRGLGDRPDLPVFPTETHGSDTTHQIEGE